ncbi:MAG: radical SAM protein [Nitrospinae bacterium]|nr:radical SAM protein [Nitrospinota bacterium]
MEQPTKFVRNYIPEDAIYNPTSLALRISYICNISCKFCYNNSTADSKTQLKEEQVIAIIEEARSEGFQTLGISGGEAMMFKDIVISGIRRARELGYTGISIVTNGFWGKSPTSAKKIITALHDAGFAPPNDMLSMSAGEFHHEWLDWKHAKNCIQAFYDTYNAPMSIDFETTPGNEGLIDEFKAYLDQKGIAETMYKFRERTLVANLGRWKDLDEGIIREKPMEVYGKCNAINRFSIQPSGDVVPCCGFNRFNPGIILGNVLNSSIAEIITNAQNNIANKYLTAFPMNKVYEELSKKFELPNKFSVICEICELIFSKKEHLDYLEERFDALSKSK